YSTYLGGSFIDLGFGIAVDSAGNAYVTGETFSTDFPTTAGAFQTTLKGKESAFMAKLNSSGSALIYSTYLGGSGSDGGNAIALDSGGNAYVTGGTISTDLPTTPGAFQTELKGTSTAFFTKLIPDALPIFYSTYLGGSGIDGGFRIAVDSAGNAYV